MLKKHCKKRAKTFRNQDMIRFNMGFSTMNDSYSILICALCHLKANGRKHVMSLQKLCDKLCFYTALTRQNKLSNFPLFYISFIRFNSFLSQLMQFKLKLLKHPS